MVFVACWAAWASLRVGAARFFAEHALRTRATREAELAASLAPADPDTHFARAWLLSNAGDTGGAVRAYERALALRPLDYVIWVELGKTREATGDTEGALEAFRRAASLAPFYAEPRWQLGNALLRAGARAEAVAELRRAAGSDPRLYPNLVRTLWHASGRDPRALVRDAGPRTPDEALALARFLIKEGEPAAGLELLRGSGAPLAEEARGTLVADLIAAERFAEAYGVWSEGRGSTGSLVGGGFEEEARSDEQGFGWRFALGGQNVRLSLDARVAARGRAQPEGRVRGQLRALAVRRLAPRRGRAGRALPPHVRGAHEGSGDGRAAVRQDRLGGEDGRDAGGGGAARGVYGRLAGVGA